MGYRQGIRQEIKGFIKKKGSGVRKAQCLSGKKIQASNGQSGFAAVVLAVVAFIAVGLGVSMMTLQNVSTVQQAETSQQNVESAVTALARAFRPFEMDADGSMIFLPDYSQLHSYVVPHPTLENVYQVREARNSQTTLPSMRVSIGVISSSALNALTNEDKQQFIDLQNSAVIDLSNAPLVTQFDKTTAMMVVSNSGNENIQSLVGQSPEGAAYNRISTAMVNSVAASQYVGVDRPTYTDATTGTTYRGAGSPATACFNVNAIIFGFEEAPEELLDVSATSPVKVIFLPFGQGEYYCYNEVDPRLVAAVRPLGDAYIEADDTLVHPDLGIRYMRDQLKLVYQEYNLASPRFDALNGDLLASYYYSSNYSLTDPPGASICDRDVGDPTRPQECDGISQFPNEQNSELTAGIFTHMREDDPILLQKLANFGGYLGANAFCSAGEVLSYQFDADAGAPLFVCVPDQQATALGIDSFVFDQTGLGESFGGTVTANAPSNGDYTLQLFNITGSECVDVTNLGSDKIRIDIEDSAQNASCAGGLTSVIGDNIGTPTAPNVTDNATGAMFVVGSATSTTVPNVDTLEFRRLAPGNSIISVQNSADQNDINVALDLSALTGPEGLNLSSCEDPLSDYKLVYDQATGFRCELDRTGGGIASEDDQEVFGASLNILASTCEPGQVITYYGDTLGGGVPRLRCVDTGDTGGGNVTGLVNLGTGADLFIETVENKTVVAKSLATNTDYLAPFLANGDSLFLDLNAELTDKLNTLQLVIDCVGQAGKYWSGQACVTEERHIESEHYTEVTQCSGVVPSFELTPVINRGSQLCTSEFRKTITFDRPFDRPPHVIVTQSNATLETDEDDCVNGSSIKAFVRIENLTATSFDIVGGGVPSLDGISGDQLCRDSLISGQYFSQFAASWMAVEGDTPGSTVVAGGN